MKKLIAIVVVLAFALAGCAAINRVINDNELVSQLAVEAATARVLHEHPGWTSQIISITENTITLIDAGAMTELSMLDEYVTRHIPWDRLMPGETILVQTVLAEVRKNITDSLRARGVSDPGTQLVEVRKALGWINGAARRAP